MAPEVDDPDVIAGYIVDDNQTGSERVATTAFAADDVELLLGRRREDLAQVVTMTVIYCVIFVTGIVGNAATCAVIASNRYMHTATNYYLFNLAVSDLLVLVLGLPQETYSFWSAYPWIFGETFCVLRTMAAETSTYASILTITAFTVERYVAICHPMRAQSLSSPRRAVRTVVGIWAASAACSAPIVAQYGVVYLPDVDGRPIDESATCNVRTDRYVRHAFEISTFLFFFAPMTIITVLYALIGLTIRRSAALSRCGSDVSSYCGAGSAGGAGSGGKRGGGGATTANVEDRDRQLVTARRAVLKMLGKRRRSSRRRPII